MEEELKYALSRRSYEKLLATVADRADVHQVNTYFETSDLAVRRAHAGLRVRIENGKRASITLKCALASTAQGARQGWHRRQEWESALPLPTARALIARRRPLHTLRSKVLQALRKHLAQIDPRALRPIGSLENWRRPVPVGRYAGELDRWRVGKCEFYELEIETRNRRGAEKAVAALFKTLKIPVRPRASTKLSTFFRLTR